MKKFSKFVWGLLVASFAIGFCPSVYAQGSLTDVLGNVIQGVFTKSDLSVYDICGQWTANGSAVNFQSDNLLKKAGGAAAAGVVENKINPYFEKLGLNNAVMTIEADSTFTLKAKKLNLTGTLVSNGDGTFTYNMKAFNKIPIGSVKAYVQKSGNNLDVMFDANKLMSLLSGVAKLTNISVAKTVVSLLDSYDGLCIGLSMTKTGDVKMPENYKSSNSGIGDVLNGILGGGKSSSKENTSAPADSVSTKKSSSGLGGLLENVLGGKSSNSDSSISTATEPNTTTTDKSNNLGGMLENVLGGNSNSGSSTQQSAPASSSSTTNTLMKIGGELLKGKVKK